MINCAGFKVLLAAIIRIYLCDTLQTGVLRHSITLVNDIDSSLIYVKKVLNDSFPVWHRSLYYMHYLPLVQICNYIEVLHTNPRLSLTETEHIAINDSIRQVVRNC